MYIPLVTKGNIDDKPFFVKQGVLFYLVTMVTLTLNPILTLN